MAIRILDKSVYELIAAGEMIERPSSVVKELVENSIDAGAKNITVEIKNGGRSYIRVTDNGCGIAPEDIPVAFERHATSKIVTKEDLEAIETLGFRGEALASICAVSKIDLLTKRKGDKYGVHFACEGENCLVFEDSGCPDGTTFTIRDLFYNVPVRLKFLKKDVSEGNAVATVVSKIALSHPEISFKFIRDNKTDLITPGDGKLLSAVYAVMGKDFHGSLIPVEYSLSGVRVTGYVTKPLMSKANRSFQNFFINGRLVKSVTCMVALEEAYRNSIMTGKFPGCVLMLDLDPASTDVNVHPTKMEIRFSDEKPVYDAVYFAVKNALMIFDAPIEGGISVPIEPPKNKALTVSEIFKKPETPAKQLIFSSSPAPEPFSVEKIAAKTIFAPQFSERPAASEKKPDDLPKAEKGKLYYRSEQAAPVQPSVSTPAPSGTTDNPSLSQPVQVVGEVFKTYIVAQRGEEMYLIDKHAAHERYNFDRLKKGLSSVDSQGLLTPFTVTLSYEGHTAVAENLPMLERFGFDIDVLDPPSLRLLGIPILLTDEDPADLLTHVADNLALGRKNGGEEIFDELFHSVACKASIKANSFNSLEELTHLAQLVIDNEILYCPHGRPAIVKFSERELERLFKRVV